MFRRRLRTKTSRFQDELNGYREIRHAYVSIGVHVYWESLTRVYARVDGALGFAAAPGGW